MGRKYIDEYAYILFLLDEDGKRPKLIIGAEWPLVEAVYNNMVDEYGKLRLQIRQVTSPATLYADTSSAFC